MCIHRIYNYTTKWHNVLKKYLIKEEVIKIVYQKYKKNNKQFIF